MKRFFAVIAAIIIVASGCAVPDLDGVFGRSVSPTPVKAPDEPARLDCDLIFPAPARDSLAP